MDVAHPPLGVWPAWPLGVGLTTWDEGSLFTGPQGGQGLRCTKVCGYVKGKEGLLVKEACTVLVLATSPDWESILPPSLGEAAPQLLAPLVIPSISAA